MTNCPFCKIIERQLPARIVFEDDRAIAFEDTNPQAPIHSLVVPKKHIESLNSLSSEDEALLGYLLAVARKIANQKGIGENGYRTVINTNLQAGQSVYHLHIHVLGGRLMRWPPG